LIIGPVVPRGADSRSSIPIDPTQHNFVPIHAGPGRRARDTLIQNLDLCVLVKK